MPKKISKKKFKLNKTNLPIVVAIIALIGTFITALSSASSSTKTVPGFLLFFGLLLFVGSIVFLGMNSEITSRILPNRTAVWALLIISIFIITISTFIYSTTPIDKLPPLINPTLQIKPTNTVTATSTPTKTIASPTAWQLENSTVVAPDSLCSITVNDYQEVDIENVKRVQFIVRKRNSQCSWIIPLNGYDASTKRELVFWVRGEWGGEEYEVGIKDKFTRQGEEPKVPQTAQRNWTQVIISLDEFKYQNSSFYQDFSFLENLSLNFNSLGDGTIYISQIIFMPE